jgi:hypothetical protein
MALAKSVECGNGLVVSASGHIITDRNLVSGCQVIVAAGVGNADQIAEDTNNGLALLKLTEIKARLSGANAIELRRPVPRLVFPALRRLMHRANSLA